MTLADVIADRGPFYPAGTALCYRGVDGEYTAPEYYVVGWPGAKLAVILAFQEPGENLIFRFTRWHEPVTLREPLTIYPEEWTKLLGEDENPKDWEVVLYEVKFMPLTV